MEGYSLSESVNLGSMKLVELKSLAGSLGIKGTSAMRKGDLVTAIQSAGSQGSAPAAERPVTATVSIGGSKSITNRALIIAALSSTPSTIHGALRSRDTDLMISALEAMGIEIRSGSKSSGTPNRTAG